MRSVGKALLAATLVVGTTVAATAPAQADRGSTAIVAGLVGVGAAIASDHHRGYYAEPVQYYAAPAYYGGYGYDYAPAYYGSYGYSYGYDRGRHYGHDRYWRDDRRYDHHDRRDHGRDRDWRR